MGSGFVKFLYGQRFRVQSSILLFRAKAPVQVIHKL